MTDPHTTPAAVAPPSKLQPTALIVATAVAVALAATAMALTSGAPAKPAVPDIAGIPRPAAACTPAADKKIGPGEDLSKTRWVGWVDGRQTDMPAAQAITQRLAGREVRDAWYCPPRADR